MIELPAEDICLGCGACVDVCGHQALSLIESENGFYVPQVDAQLCVHCDLCKRHCPILHPGQIVRNNAIEEQVYAAWSLDAGIRDSASGGVFYQVAKEFLTQPNSWVAGAALTPHSTVQHRLVSSLDELSALQNSKYQQSDTSGIYRIVMSKLKAGDRVLFSGTPCQIAALYSQPGIARYRGNLYTLEVICHGVPSNYMAQLAIKVAGASRIVAYRTKSQGWEKGNRTVYDVRGENVEISRYRKDFHFRSYLSFTWLRPGCCSCPYARIERVADLTMGDFWGYPKYYPQNEMGVSVLLCNNAHGEQLLQSTSRLHRHPVDWSEAIAINQNIYMPTFFGGRGAKYIHQIKQYPLWLQKLIFQHGFTNKWLFGLGQVMESIGSRIWGVKNRKYMIQKRNEALNKVEIPKKKVGILTTYFAANFGAMLQPYALMRVLENAGFAVSFVRYCQRAIYDGHRPSLSRIVRNRDWGALFALPFSILQNARMQNFKRQYLKVDDNFDSTIPADLDYYVFGSDQIWNPKNTNGFDSIYFGDFETKHGAKKIAYAASGECIDDTMENRCYLSDRLRNFDAVAVREQSLQQKLAVMTGVPGIEVVLDPTLLATRDILDELPGTEHLQGQKYVMLYHVRNSVPYLSRIHAFARSKGMALLIVSSSPKKDYLLYALRHRDVVYLPSAGMSDFLGAVRGASYVFTPSFHGNVFAIIYGKPLFSMSLGDGLDTRAHDLLVQLGMKHRIVSLQDDWDQVHEVDYQVVYARLEKMREHSLDYLLSHVK